MQRTCAAYRAMNVQMRVSPCGACSGGGGSAPLRPIPLRHSYPKQSSVVALGQRPCLPSRNCVTSAAMEQPATSSSKRSAGRMTYRPATYTEMVQDAVRSIYEAVQDGQCCLLCCWPHNLSCHMHDVCADVTVTHTARAVKQVGQAWCASRAL